LGKLLISQSFGMSARQAENGFMRGRIVSSRRRRNIRDGKVSDFNEAKNENKNRVVPALSRDGRMQRARYDDDERQALSPTGENR
jgi:hypothetical protein